jgi:hypothetical protein
MKKVTGTANPTLNVACFLDVALPLHPHHPQPHHPSPRHPHPRHLYLCILRTSNASTTHFRTVVVCSHSPGPEGSWVRLRGYICSTSSSRDSDALLHCQAG